ncbi:MAG: TipAS antibiotic-recognition domain-containing protein, partial [Clostridia bacterium]|nr:TipAS antibiotic-recognition domain-containing protein [Clostridia bacterium]
LKLKREKLTKLISLTESIMKGDTAVDLSAFDDSKEKEYAEEAKRRWGGTAAWREYEAKKPGQEAAEGLMELFREFGELKELPVDDARVTEAVRGLRKYITENYYECTDGMLLGLGRMYSGDPRFKENIDKAGGVGTAEFVTRAIEAYCKKG